MTAKNKSSEIYSNGYKALSSNFLILPSADIAPIFRDKFSRFMSAKSSLPLILIYAPRCLWSSNKNICTISFNSVSFKMWHFTCIFTHLIRKIPSFRRKMTKIQATRKRILWKCIIYIICVKIKSKEFPFSCSLEYASCDESIRMRKQTNWECKQTDVEYKQTDNVNKQSGKINKQIACNTGDMCSPHSRYWLESGKR